MKQANLYINIKKKKPAMSLIPGSFNADIPGFQIKFDEKYGEEENLLKNVLIYDLRGGRGNQKVITAERGKVVSEEGSRYITMILNNGNFYEEHVKSARTPAKRLKMAASSATFDEYEFNIDVGDVFDDGKLDSINSTGSPMMYRLEELKDTVPKLKFTYDEDMQLRANNIFASIDAKELIQIPDSLQNKKLSKNTLDNFELEEKIMILNASVSKTNRLLSTITNNTEILKFKRKILNLYETEYYNRVALSLSCIILFFIGAPLGSIVRKGGFGMPMILAIAVYVTYHFSNTFGKGLAENSSVTAFLGSWISGIIMIPIAILLTYRATKDKGIFNIDTFLQPITELFKKILPKKRQA
jgi:lipopolysaccharide export system permease protein